MARESVAAELVREARHRAALSQRELAERAGTAQSVVGRIESGQSSPTVETLANLLDAAGFELDAELIPRRDRDPVIELYKRDIEKASDPAAVRAQKIAEFRERFASPYVAAERGFVDEVILPRTTRAKLVQALATLDHKRDKNPPKKHGNIPL